MSHLQPDGWRRKAGGAIVLVLGVAIVARVAWELLAPLVPSLVVLLLLLGIYAVLLGRFRR